MEIDLGSENFLAAEREETKIAVEIKIFAGLSKVYDFHLAVGQFFDYRVALKVKEEERVLFVGITEDVYEEVFLLPFAQMVIAELKMKILVVNSNTNKIVKWIN